MGMNGVHKPGRRKVKKSKGMNGVHKRKAKRKTKAAKRPKRR